MYYDPKPIKFPYPLQTDKHYLEVKKNDGTVFDAKYQYVDKSKGFELKRNLMKAVFFCIVFPVMRIRLGLKVRGKENLRKYKDLISQGAVSVCNHVHMWDYLAVMSAVFPRRPDIIAWAPNMRGENKKLIRLVGGIPVPEDNVRATAKFAGEVLDYLRDGGLLHVCAEGSMWEYYAPIRPFKSGAFYFAVKSGKPIIPMAFSYRKPKGILSKIWTNAWLTLNIGEPIYPDTTIDQQDAIIKLTTETHAAVCRLAGINPEENIYPPVFNNNTRIDYYTKEYGIGYKGSW